LPLLVTFTVWGKLVVPAVTEPKFIYIGVTFIWGLVVDAAAFRGKIICTNNARTIRIEILLIWYPLLFKPE
jgi:hypothetical protein